MHLKPNSLWIVVGLFLFSEFQNCSLASPTKVSIISVIKPIQEPFNINNNISRKFKFEEQENINVFDHRHHNRIPRAVHQISLSDPLDCLSQIVCGINTWPPQVPSVRTKTANDFAYLLRNVILRLKKQEVPNLTMNAKDKLAEVKKTNSKKKSKEEQNDDESDEEEYEDKDLVEDKNNQEKTDDNVAVEKSKEKSAENDDYVAIQDLYPPLGFSNNRKGRSKQANNVKKSQKRQTNGKISPKKLKTKPLLPSPLQKLRMETDIREKLRSDARCSQGILDHTCPFKYQELMVLTSGVLERQRTVSYSTNKILPLVGYLLKSRSLTETLKSTFTALERINNITITKDANKEPISFNAVYDEIINGDIGDIGIRIVETKNEVASSNAWEDDEFDEALSNPVVQRKRIPGYQIQNRNKDKKDSKEDDASDSEEPPRPELEVDNVFDEIFPNDSPESDDNESDNGQETQESEDEEDIPLPQLYGIDKNKK